jgi:peptide/nickel transport system permease protein
MKLNFELKLGGLIAIFIVTISLLSFIWVPHDYNDMDHSRRFLPPGADHILGTDNFGRDIFSRIMTGGRNSLLLALSTVAGAAAIGALLGLLAG